MFVLGFITLFNLKSLNSRPDPDQGTNCSTIQYSIYYKQYIFLFLGSTRYKSKKIRNTSQGLKQLNFSKLKNNGPHAPCSEYINNQCSMFYNIVTDSPTTDDSPTFM